MGNGVAIQISYYDRDMAMGKKACEAGDSVKAIHHFGSAISQRPTWLQAYWSRSEAYQANKIHAS